jgi:hypothetical protein
MYQKVIQKIEDFCFFMLDPFIYRNTQNNRYNVDKNVIVEDCTFAIFFPTEFALFLLSCHIIQKSKKKMLVSSLSVIKTEVVRDKRITNK